MNALAFDDNRPSYEMAKPSKVCDVHTIDTDSTTKCSNNPMPLYKYSDPGTPIIKAFTLTRNGIAGSASHIGHPARASGDDLGIETRQLGLGLSFLGARWGSRREHGCMVFILVCGSSRECDLRLTQMALVTLQLFSRLWQYKSQAFLCTSSPLFILVCGSSRECDLMLVAV